MKTSSKSVLGWMGMLVVAGSLCSCSVLESDHYPGEKVDLKTMLPARSCWVWESGDGDGCDFQVILTGSNTVTVAGVDWSEKKGIYTISFPVVISSLGDQFFVSSRYNLDGKEMDHYFIQRLQIPLTHSGAFSDVGYLLEIDEAKVRQDIDEGKLSAEIDKHGIVFQGSKSDLDKYLRDNNSIYVFDRPRVLRRVSKMEE